MNLQKAIVTLLLLGSSFLGFSQDNISFFKNITIEDGLSNNSITNIYQDQGGFIWIGTIDGLNRFDGYQFHIYRNERKDTASLSSSFIRALHQDSKGRLWVGTRSGLNRYDPTSDTFVRCFNHGEKNRQERNPDIRHISEDENGKLWLCTYNSGLVCYNPNTDSFKSFYHPEIKNRQSEHQIFGTSFLDSENLLVPIYTQGLYVFNLETEEFRKIETLQKNKETYRTFTVSDTSVYLIDRYNGIFEYVKTAFGLVLKEGCDLQIPRVYFMDLCIDDKQNIWAGSF